MAPSLSETVPVADGIIAPVAGGGTSMTDLVWPDTSIHCFILPMPIIILVCSNYFILTYFSCTQQYRKKTNNYLLDTPCHEHC